MGIGNHNTYYVHNPNCGMECPVDGCDYESDSKRGISIHCGRSHKNNPFRVDCTCNYCGDSFTVPKSKYEKGEGKYCSRECRGKHKNVNCECNYCGDSFTISKSKYENGRGKYCSLECQGKHKTEKRTIDCECNYCDNSFTVPKSEYERGVGKYCSNKCQSKDGTVECECNYCGNSFTVPKSKCKNGRGKYCSRKCQKLDKRKSNPDLRDSPAYRQFRTDVLDRDNYSCVDCGTSDNLHVHHIVPISEDESQATDVANGVTVCVPCHADRHEQRGDNVVASSLRSQNITGFEIGVIDSQQSLETFADD